MYSGMTGQKAPSAKRCIKTALSSPAGRFQCVRKHRAPKGALRPHFAYLRERGALGVRKHRAPKGALRLIHAARRQFLCEGSQKAPSAKRCIKTHETQ